MEISGLTTRQKSVLLARAMGWLVDVRSTGEYGKRGEQYRATWLRPDGTELDSDVIGYSEEEAAEVQVTDFYSTRNMSQAWRVLGWASDTAARASYYVAGTIDPRVATQWIDAIDCLMMDIWRNANPTEAQAAWLDKILSLTIEAGLILSDKVVVEK